MHRARHAVPPLPHQDPQNRDWKHPRIRFAIVSRARLDILGPFESEIRPITDLATRASGRSLPERDGCVILPVYDLQVANIRAKFPGVQILDDEFTIASLGQASIRYVPSIRTIPLNSRIGSVQNSRLFRGSRHRPETLRWHPGIFRASHHFPLYGRLWSAIFERRRSQARDRSRNLDDRARGRQCHLRTGRGGRQPRS